MKQIPTTPQMVKSKINYLEEETKRLTNRNKARYSERVRIFGNLSALWISTYTYLNEISQELPREEYKKYLEKMMKTRDMMTDFAILGR